MGRLVGMVVGNPAVLLYIALAAFGLGLVSGGGGAWWLQGLRLTAAKGEYEHAKAEGLQVALTATRKADGERDALAVKLAALDKTHSDELKRINDEKDHLADCLRTGKCGLRVAATCPRAPSGLPQAPAGSGVDSSTGPEFGPDARQDYLNLRSALKKAAEQINACGESLAAITGQQR